ncbi:V-type ATPase subunit [Paramaledivibacter caminithermalis]|jgi:V/A-type H+-transporting ATPase subunit C|uniref:V/A-type H+-transporting ATPase subunit C n=1 Tax=Paramaledivibacter caminithermalis (strain DSM 15212 / CIP 107654 / DViRD3) TaxID=1121301 RepID=A0A1M6L106_PARC5|nr:V-type ATPase subunit [Paramaledivibacter caminithermalis]SHJ64829.1 V/A-type H+-transporting ATPase subunit C [Paramaledivibacter caminithermalis DSM 15212]
MGSVRRFAAINTKIRSLEGRLLTQEDYNKLIFMKNVGDIANYLKDKTAYNKVLENVNTASIKRDQLELLLKKYIVKQYEKLIHFFTDEYRRLFKTLFLRYEIEDLKIFLRAVDREESLRHVKDLIVYSGIYSTIDYEALSSSKNLEELINNLKNTIYHNVLKSYTREVPEKRLFYMEMSLDRLYFKLLTDVVEKLDKRDRDILRELLGKNIDLMNLQWIYRGLKFYRLSPEELINYTLHKGYYLNYRRIKELCYTKNEKELINMMIDWKYGFLFDNKKTLEIFMERRIERYLYFLFLDYKRKEKMNIIESVVYIHLLEFEMRDIISIVEAVRYGIEKEAAKKYLVRKL